MKLTSLTIGPRDSWSDLSETNPLICRVKLQTDYATVETILNPDCSRRILDICAEEVAQGASDRVNEFREHVLAIPAKAAALVDGTGDA